MAGGALDVIVRFIGDTTKVRDEVSKVEGTGTRIKSWAKGVGSAVATGFAVAKVAEFGKASVDAAIESEVATNRLAAVFRSMGDTTGTAAKQAEKYAQTLSSKTGIDDELIMSSQALLATFSQVSNETGRQAGIFDRATAAAADLAAAGFGDLDTNAKQLGKALQDPVKGITALAKSGVTFSEAQKKQIAGFVKTGDVLSAQKIVLGEVEHQVKGTAEATATSTDKMNVAWGNTQEEIGAALLPVLEQLMPILEQVAIFIQQNITWIMPLAIVLGVLAVAWNIASMAATLFGVSMMAALWPVLLVIAAIAALIAIGVLIVKNWDTIKAAAAAVWSFMQTAWDAILGVIRGAWEWIAQHWPLLLAILTGPIGAAVAIIVTNWDKIKAAISAAFSFISGLWRGILSVLSAPFEAAARIISGVIDRIRSGISSAFSFISDIVTRITSTISGLVDKGREMGARVADLLKGPINAIIRAWNGLEIPIPKVSIGPIKFGGGSIGTPDIPQLATGGLVLETGLAVVHEGETFSGIGNRATSPAVWIEHLEVAEQLDVDLFLRRAAYAAQRERI